MRLILMGCEYAGKRTMGVEISRWWAEQTGGEFHEPPYLSFHDHFTIPHVVHAIGHEDHKELSERQMLDLNPGLLEHFQRYQILNKLHSGYLAGPDLYLIDWFYADAVFAPLYYGYGGPGQYADRHRFARAMEAELLKTMPEMVLVLMTASPEVIRQRKRDGKSIFPGRHQATHFKEEDAELVLGKFQEEYDDSLITYRKFTLDTTNATVDETLQEFISRITKYLTPEDRLRVLTHRSPEIPWL